MKRSACCLLNLCLLGSSGFAVAADLPAAPLSGPKLQEELRQPLLGSWEHVELRDLLSRIGTLRQVSIILDRRIDPNQQPAVELIGSPLGDGLNAIALQADARASRLHSVVYLGPPPAARRLRTEIEVHTAALSDSSLKIPEKRQFELLARQTWQWQDLDRPVDILRQIAETSQLEIRSLDRVPHDLWAAGLLPESTSIEALTLILIQLDLGWKWADRGQAIELTPLGPAPAVEKSLKPPRGLTVEKAAERLRAALPDLMIEPGKGAVLVRGFVEDLEAAALELTNPGGSKVTGIRNPPPLKNRRFTLKAERQPIQAIQRELEKTGIIFEYDAQAFEQAGIDLQQLVNVDVQNATADEFLTALFADQQVEWTILGLTVKLRVAE